MTPTTHYGRLFTCVYMLVGMQVVLSSLTPLMNLLHGEWREKLVDRLCACGKAGGEYGKKGVGAKKRKGKASKEDEEDLTKYALARALSPWTSAVL